MAPKNQPPLFSSESSSEKERMIVYVDGLNLYCSIASMKNQNYKWLNIENLVKTIMNSYKPLSNNNIEGIKYFTSLFVKDMEERKRQEIYIQALEKVTNNLSVFKGYFVVKKNRYEEKETDVNIACHMLQDAYENKIDTALVISGDGDLVPPVQQLIKKEKRVYIVCIPGQRGFNLEQSATGKVRITERMIKKCLMDNTIGDIQKPSEWYE